MSEGFFFDSLCQFSCQISHRIFSPLEERIWPTCSVQPSTTPCTLPTHQNNTPSCRFVLHITQTRYSSCDLLSSSSVFTCFAPAGFTIRQNFYYHAEVPGVCFPPPSALLQSAISQANRDGAFKDQFLESFFFHIVLPGNSLGSCLFLPAIDTEKQEINLYQFSLFMIQMIQLNDLALTNRWW